MDRFISVTGEGMAKAAPDTFTVSGEFAGTFKEYEDAVAASASAATGLRKAIGEAGFDMDDLRTTRLSVDPVYRSEGEVRVFHGYRFVHGIRITEPLDGESLGRLIGALVSCRGAPEFRVTYSVSDPSGAESAARQAAVKDARRKAKELAAAAGVSLGELVSVSYHSSPSHPAMLGARMAVNVDAVPEDAVFEDSVTMVWQIL